MNLDISTIMMILFIALLVVSVWKIYAFLPNEQLADDDTTIEAKEELLNIVFKTIESSEPNILLSDLYEKVKKSEEFDKERFWRFNPNKLNNLLEEYYKRHPDTQSVEDIYKKLHS